MITRETVRGSFPVRPLGEVVDFLDHKRRPVKQSDRVEGPYPYYGANGLQGSIDAFIFDEPLVLVAEDGGHFDEPERGIAYQITGKTWVNNHAHVLRPKPFLDVRFLTRVLENYDIRPFISGTTRGKLTKGQAEKIEIPLPPFEEQKRIAAILDQADALRRLRARALDRLNALRQAIFHEMFGDPVSDTARWKADADFRRGGWVNCPLGEQITLQRGKDITSKDVRPGNVPVISSGGVSFYHDEPLVNGPGVLLGRKGSVGKVHYSAGNFWPHDTTLYVKDFKRNIPLYVFYFFRQFPIARYEASAANPSLNRNNLHPVEVLWPPIATQLEFAVKIAEVDKQIGGFEATLAATETLFTSLQHRAFRGEL